MLGYRQYFLVISVAALLCSVLPSASHATNSCLLTVAGSVTCKAVVGSVYEIETTSATTFSAAKYDQMSVSCYYPSNITPVCAGGGDFDRIVGVTGNTCRQIADGAFIIHDGQTGNDTQCFQRENFGLNGIVDARQCGVIGDGKPEKTTGTYHPDDGAILKNCLKTSASNPTSQYGHPGYHIVTTGGGVILDNTTDIEIPSNMTLTCGGTSIPAAADNDFRIPKLSKAIVLDPFPTNPAGYPAKGWTVRLQGKNPALVGCTIVEGAGTATEGGGTVPNPFSPSIWYPGCNANYIDCTGHDDSATPFRSSILEASAFNPNPSAQYPASGTCPPACGPASQSVGVLIEAGGATIHDVAILGFGTCLQLGVSGTSSAPGANIQDVNGDCNTGVRVDASNAPSLSEVRINPLLTDAGYISRKITNITSSSGSYRVTVDTTATGDPDANYLIRNNDTVWIGTGDGGGAESARGRWIVSCTDSGGSCTCDVGGACQSFTLTGSASAIPSIDATVRDTFNNGTPPTALTGISLIDSNVKYLAPGQQVVDSQGCITSASNTKVTAVWPAQGIVYISKPPSCTPATEPDSITFTDNSLNGATCNHTIVDGNCVIVDVGFRFGDGFDIHNTGGSACYNCRSSEHMVSFHMNTGSNNAHLVNSVTALNVDLPDQNLWPMNARSDTNQDADRQNIVSLLIDGDHVSGHPVPPAEDADACDVEAVDSIFGQHRPVAVVVNTTCNNQNRMINIGLGVANVQDNAIGIELDSGTVALSNTGGSTANSFVADDTALAMSNVRLEKQTLYIESSTASSSISGCGNVFSAPTPYLCAPSSFTQLPGGRLTLTQGHPVMSSDVLAATTIYYSPYASSEIPIYASATGVFGLYDVGSSGIKLELDSTVQLGTTLYDLFAVVDSGDVRLCTGPAWASITGGSLVRGSTGQIQQVNGVWVNGTIMSCHFHSGASSGDHSCQPYECTYLGSADMTANGQTKQQFGPVSGSGGGGNCLCLYNAYNRVTLTSTSQDSAGQYSYTSTTWRRQNNSASNSVTGIDGLGEMQISSQLTDAMSNGIGAGTGFAIAIGIDFMFPGGTVVAPIPIVQANSTSKGTYSTTVSSAPVKGIWIAQAVEAAISGSAGTPNFGGNGYQQLSVRVQD